MNFVEFKHSLEVTTGLHQDSLHIFVALLIQILVAAVSRRGVAHPLPWICVLLAELVNEGLDLHLVRLRTGPDIWASVHDVWNTMLLPTMLLVIGRFAPWMLQPRSGRAPEHESGE